jgi:hypothetical protein
MNLQAALTKFVAIFSRSPENFGSAKILPTPISFIPHAVLNEELTEYFSILELGDKTQIGAQFQLRLFSRDELEGAQQGRRTWYDSSGHRIDNRFWKSSWIVIGDRNGDALFVDTDDGSVLGSVQKKTLFLATNLSSFLEALALGMEIEMDKYVFEVTDDDFNIQESFLKDIERVSMTTLGESCVTGYMEYFFG